MRKRFKASFAAASAAFVVLSSIALGQTVPKLTSAQWQADVRFLGDELPKRHRNAFHRVKREDFEATVKTVHDAVPTMTEDDIVVGLMKIVAMVRDGHTNLIPRPYFRSGIYPIRLYQFSDGLFVQKVAPEYADALGGKVLRIGKMSTEDALKAVREIASADNDMGVKQLSPLLLTLPEILAGSKIVDDKQRLELVVEKNGKRSTINIRPSGKFHDVIENPDNWLDATEKKSASPLYLCDPANFYWYEYLRDRKVVYVKHFAIANKPNEPVADFYKRVFEFVEANPVDKFVLDLRNNGGGNNGLNIPVVVGLIRSKINKRGKLFVITGRETFSAAENLVNQIERYTEAIFVGEPTAGHPNHYGDNRPFTLPNSGLTVRASTLWWQDLDPRDVRAWTAPEIAAELSFDDYRSGLDPALQAVFDYVPGSTFTELVQNTGVQSDLSSFAAKYRSIKGDPKSKYVNSEAVVNRFGYALLAAKRITEAIEVFKLNVESYPRSANVYDSLGDAYEAAGRKDDAIKSFERALAIDPSYPSALEALRRLKGNN